MSSVTSRPSYSPCCIVRSQPCLEDAVGMMRPQTSQNPSFQARKLEEHLCSLCVLRCCADPCSLLLQFNLQSTTSSTLARMSKITIELERDECSVRSVADEPRCEFPVAPDRLVGEPRPFLSRLTCPLGPAAAAAAAAAEPSSHQRFLSSLREMSVHHRQLLQHDSLYAVLRLSASPAHSQGAKRDTHMLWHLTRRPAILDRRSAWSNLIWAAQTYQLRPCCALAAGALVARQCSCPAAQMQLI